jgi:hypothetical protein
MGTYGGYEALAQLADILDSDVPLKVGEFDFNTYQDRNANNCCTAGCAMGEAIERWASEKRDSFYDKKYKMPRSIEIYKWGMTFFGLSHEEYCHLFVSHSQREDLYGGKYLTYTTTRSDVAANIREFLKKKGFIEE